MTASSPSGPTAGDRTTRAEQDTFEQAWALAAGVEGWLTRAQGRRLWDAARRLPRPGRVVEIGSFRGRSTVLLARGAGPQVQIVAIDPHLGSDRGPREIAAQPALGEADLVAFRAGLSAAGVEDRVRHVRRRSGEADEDVRGTFDLLYVDGAHRVSPARRDLELWGSRLAPGGVLMVHDAFSSVGVTVALLSVLAARRGWRYVGRTGSLAEYRRAHPGESGRWLGTVRQLAQLPWFVRNLLVKALLVARLGRATRLLGHRSSAWPY